MKSLLTQGFMTLMLITIVAVAPAGATLIDRGNGLIYDDDLNITWLQNANLAATNQFGLTQSVGIVPGVGEIGSTGRMSWYTANNWITGMNAANHKGFNNWRLPITTQPDPSCANQLNGLSYGTGCTGSELGHLYNVEGITWVVPDPFDQVQYSIYWSGKKSEADNDGAWVLYFTAGSQGLYSLSGQWFPWAVRSGDVNVHGTVPEPGTIFLLGTGLAGLVVWRRKKTV